MRPGAAAENAVQMRPDPVSRALSDLMTGPALRKHFFAARGISEFRRRSIGYDGICCRLLQRVCNGCNGCQSRLLRIFRSFHCSGKLGFQLGQPGFERRGLIGLCRPV